MRAAAAAILLTLGCARCSGYPGCDESAYTAAGICVSNPELGPGVVEAVIREVHAAVPVGSPEGRNEDYGVALVWGWEDLPTGVDGRTYFYGYAWRDVTKIWIDIRPGLPLEERIFAIAHELLHVQAYYKWELKSVHDEDPRMAPLMRSSIWASRAANTLDWQIASSVLAAWEKEGLR